MERVKGIKKLTDNRFLNLYELDATFRDGSSAPYYVASRRKNIESLKAVTHDNHADGVILYGVHGEARDKVVDVIKRVNPDFIITHNPDDYMPDHTAVSRLVFDAAFTATLPNYISNVTGHAKMVPIFYMDTLAGVNFNPTEFVDVSPFIDKKLEMLECHESQIVWMRDHDNIDFPDMVKTCSRYRGYQCGADYAEGFRQCQVYLKGTTKRYLP